MKNKQLEVFYRITESLLSDISYWIAEHNGFYRFGDRSNSPELPVLLVSKDAFVFEEYRCEAIRLNENDELEVFCDNRAFRNSVWMEWSDDEMQALDAHEHPWHCLDAESMNRAFEGNLESIYNHIIENCI